jgi:outer membrane cobalamin receptor
MRSMFVIATIVAASACASNSVKSSEEGSARASREVISRAQIETMNATDAYDVVQRIRPEFLRQRGASSIQGGSQLAVVYVDGVRRGGPEALRQLRATEVEEIRFVSGTDATTRYGTDHGGGAIEVRSRRG